MCVLTVEARHHPPPQPRSPKPSQSAAALRSFSSPLFTDFAIALHKHCGLSVIFDEKSFVFKFRFVCVVGYPSEPNCGSVGAAYFLSLIVHIAGALTAVICLSSTSVMAQRKHKTNPARAEGGERGTPADGLTVGREKNRLT